MSETRWFKTEEAPPKFDPARAERTLADLHYEGFDPDPPARAFLASVFSNSPYLARLAVREAESLQALLAKGPEVIVARAESGALDAAAAATPEEAMKMLRGAKRRAALAIALADISGAWDLDQVTGALSRFAKTCIKASLRFSLRQAAREEGRPDEDGAALEASTGVIVLGMGKLGAAELNYSSDIDLVVFYEASRFPFRRRDDARSAAVAVVRNIVRLLSETTPDGFVFRTDLRLRPDAGATQVAISTDAAENYYEAMGQNWERAAFIKARPCAGDPDAAARFLKAIEPFIWRRSLDYSAIDDIHSIKRQIHAHGGHGAIAVKGHNVKLGRGGIREIEFFAQTQQLIAGGRNPALRAAGTITAIEALVTRGLVERSTAADLEDAYRFLRKLEHRLQMIEDEQTHTMPRDDRELEHVARFMGFSDTADFSVTLTAHLTRVQSHYSRLFENAPPLTGVGGSLVFTGVEDDPETLATLSGMGFSDPSHVATAVRGWHHGRIRATRSARARELLTRLMPALLAALAHTADPAAAFAQFDRFLSNLPAGVQLFSLLLARPELLALIANIAGAAPRLSGHLSRHPGTLDALLDKDFLTHLPDRASMQSQLSGALAAAPDYEGTLDAARRFAKEQSFRVGVQVIEGAASADKAGPAFADIAECVIEGLLPEVERSLWASAGKIDGGSFGVVAMGKLGGREMTAASDLDLIFIYDAPAGTEQSDGHRPMPLIVYYARLAQRFISALTSPTGAGTLYDVDMRLRPTGNKGPVAVSLESFARYQLHEAWTWERLALTRARVVTGPVDLRRRIEAAISASLQEIDPAKARSDAREMRARLASQFSPANPWDLKYARGGLIDIEFIAQTLQLCGHQIYDTNTIAALEALKRNSALDGEDANILIQSARLQQSLTQVLRIAIEGTLDAGTASKGLKALLSRAGGETRFETLQSRLFELQHMVHQVFERLIA
ncbi:MAG: bifunctional [glutamine synthetase] adenylyltransferase/[glutamine synthetase]-adenylyl-L-tyrosine phosphorylase [Alphaproteobacteria bacterium]|nr:bifunctional [glutamine synthetase] adenylyltransferase/[glutamine synthetase]-adenylyl-L-tyrosine phosphorylase [Alphaproteobacteria bacterium]